MGAAPVGYETIITLSTIPCEELDIGDGTAWHFPSCEDKTYPLLSAEDQSILDTVIKRFGKAKTGEIAEAMHREDAWKKTVPEDIIPFRYAESLSLK